jgi:hypothetical protein
MFRRKFRIQKHFSVKLRQVRLGKLLQFESGVVLGTLAILPRIQLLLWPSSI